MQLFFLLFTLFELVYTSPVAYPLSNNTLAHRGVINATEELDTGGHAGFPVNSQMRWPRLPNYQVLIPWCFKDSASEQAIGAHIIDRAWETWTRTLGVASLQNSHNLYFSRWLSASEDSYPYCYDANGQWNHQIPPQTVCISFNYHYLPGVQARSTVGYKATDNTPGRYWMVFSHDAIIRNPEHVAAHELGHVFGLLHEHQRADRDFYINYNCRNVIGFDGALAKARADGYTEDQLCTQLGVAQMYGWAGAEFVRFAPSATDIVSPYDFHSIMHYDCRHGANSAIWGPDPTNPLLFPMYAFNVAGDEAHFLPLKGGRHYPHFDISAGDAATIRAMYPFYPNAWRDKASELSTTSIMTDVADVDSTVA